MVYAIRPHRDSPPWCSVAYHHDPTRTRRRYEGALPGLSHQEIQRLPERLQPAHRGGSGDERLNLRQFVYPLDARLLGRRHKTKAGRKRPRSTASRLPSTRPRTSVSTNRSSSTFAMRTTSSNWSASAGSTQRARAGLRIG